MNVARCTWDDNVEGRSGAAPGPAAGAMARGVRREARGARGWSEGREGLKVERCTLHVGRQRGGAQRRCARTGYGGGARREARGARCEGMGRGARGVEC